MKAVTVCVLVLCVTGSLAGLLPAAVSVGQTAGAGQQVQGVNQAASQARDAAQKAAAGQTNSASKKDFGQTNQLQEDSAHQSNSANQAAASSNGQRSANHDQAFNQAANSASQASSASSNQNAAKSNSASQATNQDLTSNILRNFRNNNIRKEGINYAYDKKFDLNNNNNGAYVYANDDNSHALDNIRDRSSGYVRNVDKQNAAAAAADKQAANRQAAASQNQHASQAARDAFGRNADQAAHANALQSAYNNKQDTGERGDSGNTFAARKANDLFQNNLLQDYGQKQAGQQFGAGDKQIGFGSLAFPAFGKDFGQAVGAVNQAYGHSLGAGNRLANQGIADTQDVNKNQFARDTWLNDNQAAAGNSQANRLNDQGFADKAANTNQGANAFNADAANANAAKKSFSNLDNLNEDAQFADQERTVLSDRNKNNRVYQNYVNNNNQNGNNWERLNYDKDQIDDQLAYDNTVRQDKAFRADKAADNTAQFANAHQADNAQANNAAKQAQAQDSNRLADGYQNQKAATANAQAAGRKGQENSSWKVDTGAQQNNNAYNQQNLWDQGVQGYNDGAQFYGGNYGFGNRGYGGYPYGGSAFTFGGLPSFNI